MTDPTRRTMLAALGSTTALLAGCSSANTDGTAPTETRTPTDTPVRETDRPTETPAEEATQSEETTPEDEDGPDRVTQATMHLSRARSAYTMSTGSIASLQGFAVDSDTLSTELGTARSLLREADRSADRDALLSVATVLERCERPCSDIASAASRVGPGLGAIAENDIREPDGDWGTAYAEIAGAKSDAGRARTDAEAVRGQLPSSAPLDVSGLVDTLEACGATLETTCTSLFQVGKGTVWLQKGNYAYEEEQYYHALNFYRGAKWRYGRAKQRLAELLERDGTVMVSDIESYQCATDALHDAAREFMLEAGDERASGDFDSRDPGLDALDRQCLDAFSGTDDVWLAERQ